MCTWTHDPQPYFCKKFDAMDHSSPIVVYN